MTKQANQPAFAAVAMCLDGSLHQEGLTKREYFAAMAMQGQLAFSPSDEFGKDHLPADVARISLRFADALLAELEKEQAV